MSDPVKAAIENAVEHEVDLIEDELDVLEEVVDNSAAEIDHNAPENILTQMMDEAEPDQPEDRSIFEMFETDLAAEENGRWMDIAPNVSFKLRRFGAVKSVQARDRAEKIVRKNSGRREGELTAAQNLEISTVQLAKGILVDWSGTGLRENDGTPIAFSEEAAYLVCKRLPHVTIAALALSLDMENYRIEETKETVKNS